MSKSIDLKHLGKIAEELGEAQAAVARCIIQGIEERHPVTGKRNRDWLLEELADVWANIQLVEEHFHLNVDKMLLRARRKKNKLKKWYRLCP
jgi:hypothetical protein